MLESNEAGQQSNVRGNINGGAGGIGTASGGNSGSSRSAGGTGNPGGKAGQNRGTGNSSVLGNSGTGGLLIIIAKSIVNNGSIVSLGTNGQAGTSYGAAGGSSGGGCINIIYNEEFLNNGTISVAGGVSSGVGTSGSVAAGNGYYNVCKVSGKYL